MPFVYTVFVVLIFILAGCSGSGGDPIAPAPNGLTENITHVDDILTQDWDADNHRVLWGLFDISVDTVSGKMEVVPVRGADYTFNVTMFLQPPAGNPANLGLSIIDASQYATQGLIDLDVNITHPFPTLVKIRGFDVMGVFMSDGSVSGLMDSSVDYPLSDGTEAILINADGYTRWMNSSEFTQTGLVGFTPGSKGIPGFSPTSTISGFKYYAVGLGATDSITSYYSSQPNVDERGSFTAGATLGRRYELKFPTPGGSPLLRFQYAIVASWAKPDPASLPNPDASDFPAAANLQEPFYIDITDNSSTLYYAGPADFGGDLRLDLEIFDWQGAANPQGVPGEISAIYIEDAAGTVIPGGFVDVLSSAIITTGKANSSVFTVDILNCTPAGTGRQDFLITVESASPTDYDQGFGSPYPIGAVLSAFARYSIVVPATNPCPTPGITGPTGAIMNINNLYPGVTVSGTNFWSGPQLAIELQKPSGDLIGTNVTWNSSTSAQADFDTSTVSAGMYDLYFMNGCGVPAPILPAYKVELNTPPTSSGITGPATGDGTLGIVQYNANAFDVDTDPVDTVSYIWSVTHQPSGQMVLGPVGGDPLSVDYSTLSVATHDISCTVSDGFVPADLILNYQFQRTNTQPTVAPPTGQTAVWYNWDVLTYNVVANDIDPGQTITYMWSLVQQSTIPNFTIPGDPTPGDVTLNFASLLPGPGWHDLQCEVDDGSGAPNAKTQSAILQIYVADDPYTGAIPPGLFNQTITAVVPSAQGVAGCPSWHDSFYGPLGGFPFAHPDLSIISGPSLVVPGEMVIADELGVIVGPVPAGVMGFAHFPTPFSTGAPPVWQWLTTGLFPGASEMIPSAIHFDGTSNGEMLISNSQLTNKLIGFGVPDPSAFSHYQAGAPPAFNDLFTSLPGLLSFDVAVDTSNGFDMGSPLTPMTPPMYGLYTQDVSGILMSCGGPMPGPIAANPVNIMQFPSMGVQPVGMPVDAPASVAVVAPIPAALTGPGVGVFNNIPGAPCPVGAIIFPEPYYALAIDDDPLDNSFPSNLPQPVGQWVIAATIDSERDVEIYEIDFGVPPPGPAPILPLFTIPMGSFMGGTPTAYPVDIEFISNFAGFSGSPSPIWPDELLAVLVTESVGGVWHVEIYEFSSGTPVFLSATMPVPVPPGIFPVPGAAYRLDVDEVTGNIVVLHEDTVGVGALTVTTIPY